MLTWLGYIDGIHGAPYIAAPWIRHGLGIVFTLGICWWYHPSAKICKNDFGDGSAIALPTFLGMTIFFLTIINIIYINSHGTCSYIFPIAMSAIWGFPKVEVPQVTTGVNTILWSNDLDYWGYLYFRKPSILTGLPTVNHLFWGVPNIYGNHHTYPLRLFLTSLPFDNSVVPSWRMHRVSCCIAQRWRWWDPSLDPGTGPPRRSWASNVRCFFFLYSV